MSQRPTIEGFYYWVMHARKHNNMAFKLWVARAAREHPNQDPRESILEPLAEMIYAYELYFQESQKGHQQKPRETASHAALLNALEGLLIEYAEDQNRRNEAKEGAGNQSLVRFGSSIPRLNRKIRYTEKIG